MSDEFAANAAYAEDVTDTHPVGDPRVNPVVSFGLRTAALAGLAIPVGLLVGRLVSGDSPEPVDTVALTTCCPTYIV
ncbi:hypothetical protein ACLQ2S_21135 [Micromonospora sp. DT48]|uniref:hypothetical protein n=1 Tax=unclassified Micromonospora TaxID=2617518 RepID=UPI0012BCA156|nr:hypothetical protein [Micromonospora sp. CP22]MTK04795.1 hypothetical protein [Micromonospora sp. CP22]